MRKILLQNVVGKGFSGNYYFIVAKSIHHFDFRGNNITTYSLSLSINFSGYFTTNYYMSSNTNILQ